MERNNPLHRLVIGHEYSRRIGGLTTLPSQPDAMLAVFCRSQPFNSLFRELITRFDQFARQGKALFMPDLEKEAWGQSWQLMTTLAFQSQLPPRSGHRLISDRGSIRHFTDDFLITTAQGVRNARNYSEADGYIVATTRDSHRISAVVESTLLKNVFRNGSDYALGKLNWLDKHRQSPFVDDHAPCALLVAQDSYIPVPEDVGIDFATIDFPPQPDELEHYFGCPSRQRHHQEAGRTKLIMVRFPMTRDQFKSGIQTTSEMQELLSLATQRARVAEIVEERASQLRAARRPSKMRMSLSGRLVFKKGRKF